MVWVAMSGDGHIFKPIFVKPGVKINHRYYIDRVLKPFVKEAKKFYGKRKWTFQQDSAPAHRDRRTQAFLKCNKIKFLSPLEWMPNSPDAAPCDYWLWGYLKSRLNSKHVNTLSQLKRAITRELKNIPEEMVIKAMSRWPKRVYAIYKAKGNNIEKTKI